METNVILPEVEVYEAPKATFVPLKLEERLLGCCKNTFPACDNTGWVS